ncbi:MAG: membrane protein insertion efficiency factor YidD [Alphaproteobacteria bacterium]|nr:membrane protein insertion efficiency factor YidD [Alphaproteobacteria bacterium]
MSDAALPVVRRALIAVVRLYQVFVSPLIGPVCRYHPSCSHYASEAIRHHGVIRGGWLALKRIGRCHPWAAGGVDPVPPAPSSCSTP